MKLIRTRQLRSLKPDLKRKVFDENKFPSKITRRKWDDEYIRHGFFLPEVKNRATSRLPNACFAILNIAVVFSSFKTA